MAGEIKLFGIRHHGPGCAKSLKNALEAYQPDAILIESPQEAEKLLPDLEKRKMKLPVAMLLYNEKDLAQASFYPLASFSPEYIAIRYGQKEGLPIQFFDLPAAQTMALRKEAEEGSPSEGQVEEEKQPEKPQIRLDPMSYIAELAGYPDGERWWDSMIEQNESNTEIFEAIHHLMDALRTQLNRKESELDLLREAHMRKSLRTASRQFDRIAVVCGAWHLPALDLKKYPAKADNALLKGLKKEKVKASWTPWTYEKLAFESGYGAGVLSPSWYELLFSNRQNAPVKWMVQAARFLRSKDMDASSASVIEGMRLAESLAVLRGQSIPGIEELYEASVALFGGGYPESMELIRQELIIGDKMGKLPPDVETTPLQKDFHARIKSLRLKMDEKGQLLELDLRNELHLKRSHFLNRLQILGIQWGEKQVVSGKKGSFHENWKLKWRPSFELSLLKASALGNNIKEAVSQKVRTLLGEIERVDQLTTLLSQVIEAELEAPLPTLIDAIRNKAAVSRDVEELMKALAPLAQISLYGNVRQSNREMIRKIIESLVPRICISLPNATLSINEEVARELFDLIQEVQSYILLLQNEVLAEEWQFSIGKIPLLENANPLLKGAACRMLFDSQQWEIERVSENMNLSLSPANGYPLAASWLEGFLHGNALILVHNPELWNILNSWIAKQKEEDFQEILPLLRRGFAHYSTGERHQIAGLIHKKEKNQEQQFYSYDEERGEKPLAMLHLLLGT